MNRDFRAWLTAATVSNVGDGVSFFAIGWAASAYGPDTAALVLVIESAPLALLMVVGGEVADRFGIRRVMYTCDAVMAVVMLAFAIGALVAATPVWLLAAVAFVSGTAAALRRPADGVFPRLFGDDGLARRMATVGAWTSTARIAGPAVGGIAVAALGVPGAAALDALTYAVVLIVLARVRPPHEPPLLDHHGVAAWRRIAAGARTAVRTPGIPAILATVATLAASVLPLVSLCVPIAARERGWSVLATGNVSATWVAGGLAVQMIIARHGLLAPRLAVFGPLLAVAGVVVLAVTRTPGAGLAAIAIVGAGTALLTTQLMPRFAGLAPPEMLARFQGMLQLSQTGSVLAVTPFVGAFCRFGVAWALAFIALLLVATAATAPNALRHRPVAS